MIKILEKLREKLDFAITSKTETVYRYVCLAELKYLENGQIENLGNCFYGKELANNHHYKPDIKYIHFFKDKDIPPHVISSLTKGEKFLCSFEIDSNLLRRHQGTGRYEPSGYNDYYTYIKEYALPVDKYNPDMFKGAQIYSQNPTTPDNPPQQEINDNLQQLENKDYLESQTTFSNLAENIVSTTQLENTQTVKLENNIEQ